MLCGTISMQEDTSFTAYWSKKSWHLVVMVTLGAMESKCMVLIRDCWRYLQALCIDNYNFQHCKQPLLRGFRLNESA